VCRLQLFWHAGAVDQYRDRYYALARYFQEVEVLVPNGWEEVPEGPLECDADGVTLRRTGAWLTYHPFVTILKNPGAEIDRFNPDLIYVHEEPQSIIALQVARAAASRALPLFVDSAVINQRASFWGYNIFERYVYRRANIVYYRNDLCRETLRDRGCPPKKLHGPMPNGVSTRTFHPADSEAVAQFRANHPDAFDRSEGLCVGFAGRIAYRKGIDLLLKLARKRSDVSVLLCGKVEEQDYLKQIDTGKNTTYLGHLNSQELTRFYTACDLLALPSIPTETWEEQFGRVLTEAIACGTPAIGTDIGMIAEIVGKEAVFPVGHLEGLIGLVDRLSEDSVRMKLHREQKKRVNEQFTWDVIAERVYEDVRKAIRQ
jgi:glycosyltransferase involved in cell wall biosynthesis